MKEDKKKLLEKQLLTLDREKGLGIFPELARSVSEGEKYLLVSYGGTGADVLYYLKQNLEKNLDKKDIADSIRLLAIDTDKNTRVEQVKVKTSDGLERLEETDRFTAKEFFWLDNSPAKMAINIKDAGMEPWVNPQLPGMIRADPKFLDGYGASSTRQIGRILLFPQKTVSSFEMRVKELIRELTNDNSDSLNIFIISGISGGTGSGIVVDATYLIRYFVQSMAGGISTRTKILGFILLPPTGTSLLPVDIEKGNRNGYAALKEIDHYMTIAYREEEYSQQLGSDHIRLTKNIFDTCYLIDGNTTSVVVGNPREKAKEVVSDCILDMITSLPVTEGAPDGLQTVDSFMSDAAAFSLAMVSGQKEQVAPREANYVYCAIGHGKVLVPIELMKAYVAGRAFNEMYKLFKMCGNVTDGDVKEFLDRLQIKDYNEQAQIAKVNEEVDNTFKTVNRAAKKGGPFYTINLLDAAATEAGRRYNEISGKFLVMGKEKKLEQLNKIKSLLAAKNDEIFTVYVEVMEQMRKYFKKEHDVLCDATKFETYTRATYTFTPINLSTLDEKSQIVKEYLDDLVSTKRVDSLTEKLTAQLIAKRAEWTELIVPKDSPKQARFAGARLIREFWEQNIGKIVNATVEDYLIKYYSGDKEAGYKIVQTPEGPAETEETKRWLSVAAKEIVDKMMGPAGIANPLAAIREDLLALENFNGKNFFLVPEAAPHLRKYIEEELKTKITDKSKLIVASSSANDRISCYAQFTGIPAYMFSWAKNGESAYEKALSAATVGLHMSETKGGNLWRNYPNLIVESIWPKISSPEYYNKREHEIGKQAQEVFEKANLLGLADQHALSVHAGFAKYALLALPQEYRPDDVHFKNVDSEMEGTAAKINAEKALAEKIEEKAQTLFAKQDWSKMPVLSEGEIVAALKESDSPVVFTEKDMQFSNTVMTAYTDYVTPKPDHWEETLAAKLLRTCPEFMNDMRGTVLVMENVADKVNNVQQAKNRIRQFAKYLAVGLFHYNEDLLQWIYEDEGVETVLADIEYGNEEMKTAEYFFLFNNYLSDAKKIDKAVSEELSERTRGADKAETIEKAKVIKEKAAELKAYLDKVLGTDKTDNTITPVTTLAFRKACGIRGYDADAIISCYKELRDALQYV